MTFLTNVFQLYYFFFSFPPFTFWNGTKINLLRMSGKKVKRLSDKMLSASFLFTHCPSTPKNIWKTSPHPLALKNWYSWPKSMWFALAPLTLNAFSSKLENFLCLSISFFVPSKGISSRWRIRILFQFSFLSLERNFQSRNFQNLLHILEHWKQNLYNRCISTSSYE